MHSDITPEGPALVESVRTLTCVALMVGCLALAWTVVFRWRIGPVVAVLDAQAGQGLHSGDIFALPLLLMGVALYGELLRT